MYLPRLITSTPTPGRASIFGGNTEACAPIDAISLGCTTSHKLRSLEFKSAYSNVLSTSSILLPGTSLNIILPDASRPLGITSCNSTLRICSFPSFPNSTYPLMDTYWLYENSSFSCTNMSGSIRWNLLYVSVHLYDIIWLF